VLISEFFIVKSRPNAFYVILNLMQNGHKILSSNHADSWNYMTDSENVTILVL
jgi:hypothetical protein